MYEAHYISSGTITMEKHQTDACKVDLLSLSTELLVIIISFLSLLRDKVKLRYVSRWMRCAVEETPSLWKEFVWPYYDKSREEYCMEEVLRVCGQHIKVLSFPNCKIPSTLVDMLQYCKNVQHLSLPSTKLDSELLRQIVHHMGCLQTLELEVDNDSNVKQLFFITSDLRELIVQCSNLTCCANFWKEEKYRPPNFTIATYFEVTHIIVKDCTYQLVHLPSCIPAGTTANFKLCCVEYRCRKVPCIISPRFPFFQLQFEGSGQVTIPCVKLSDFGILGLGNDLGLMTDCRYNGKTMYLVNYNMFNKCVIPELSLSACITEFKNLVCTTHFDMPNCLSFRSGHLEQLAIACPNLQRLNVEGSACLSSLQGLQAIASHCHNLQGLNLLGIHVSGMENRILLWEILSDMKLTHLAVEVCILRSTTLNRQKLIHLYQKCRALTAVETRCKSYDCSPCDDLYIEDDVHCLTVTPSSITELYSYWKLPTAVQNVLNGCKNLKCARFDDLNCYKCFLSLNLTTCSLHLEQLCIISPLTHVCDDFMTSVSVHGGLVHVLMFVELLTTKGVECLVANSPKLITFHAYICNLSDTTSRKCCSIPEFHASLEKRFNYRKLFTDIGNYQLKLENARTYNFMYDIALKLEVLYQTDLVGLF